MMQIDYCDLKHPGPQASYTQKAERSVDVLIDERLVNKASYAKAQLRRMPLMFTCHAVPSSSLSSLSSCSIAKV